VFKFQKKIEISSKCLSEETRGNMKNDVFQVLRRA
jgi:hypothetical protein